MSLNELFLALSGLQVGLSRDNFSTSSDYSIFERAELLGNLFARVQQAEYHEVVNICVKKEITVPYLQCIATIESQTLLKLKNSGQNGLPFAYLGSTAVHEAELKWMDRLEMALDLVSSKVSDNLFEVVDSLESKYTFIPEFSSFIKLLRQTTDEYKLKLISICLQGIEPNDFDSEKFHNLVPVSLRSVFLISKSFYDRSMTDMGFLNSYLDLVEANLKLFAELTIPIQPKEFDLCISRCLQSTFAVLDTQIYNHDSVRGMFAYLRDIVFYKSSFYADFIHSGMSQDDAYLQYRAASYKLANNKMNLPPTLLLELPPSFEIRFIFTEIQFNVYLQISDLLLQFLKKQQSIKLASGEDNFAEFIKLNKSWLDMQILLNKHVDQLQQTLSSNTNVALLNFDSSALDLFEEIKELIETSESTFLAIRKQEVA